MHTSTYKYVHYKQYFSYLMMSSKMWWNIINDPRNLLLSFPHMPATYLWFYVLNTIVQASTCDNLGVIDSLCHVSTCTSIYIKPNGSLCVTLPLTPRKSCLMPRVQWIEVSLRLYRMVNCTISDGQLCEAASICMCDNRLAQVTTAYSVSCVYHFLNEYDLEWIMSDRWLYVKRYACIGCMGNTM